MSLLAFLVIAFAVVGVGSVLNARECYRRAGSLRGLATAPICKLDAGRFAVEGEIVVLRDRLCCPLSQAESVYFRFSIVDYTFVGVRRKPRQIASDSQRVIFGVRDETGVVQVDLQDVKPICASFLSVPDRKLPGEFRQALSRKYGTSGCASRYTEHSLRPGEHVYVCGDVTRTAHGELRFSGAMRSNHALHVSTQGKEPLLRDANSSWVSSLVFGIGCLLASLAAACAIAVILVYKLPWP